MSLKNWYPFYVGDYSRDTARLSIVEHGAYILLLNEYYSTGEPLQNDLIQLYRVCRAFEQTERDAIEKVLDLFFELDEENNCFRNSKADEELDKKQAISTKRAKAVKKRWDKSKKKDDTSVDTNVYTNGIPSTSTSTDISITNVIESPPSTLLMPDGSFLSPQQFGEYLWGLYPSVGRRKGHKAKFIEQIKRHLKKGVNHETIIKGTTEYAGYCQSTGEYNQDAQRWARDAGWDNEYTASQPAHRPHAGNGNGKRDESIHALASDAEQAKKMLGGFSED